MERRKFLGILGASGIASVTGCLTETTQYSLDTPVEISKGIIELDEVVSSQYLFSNPTDTPPNVLSRVDSQFIVFIFEVKNIDISDDRKVREYIGDSLRYQLSPDTVAPQVREPLRQNNREDIVSVAFQVPYPFYPEDTRLVFSDENTTAEWPLNKILTSGLSSSFKNPAKFAVEDVRIPQTTSSDTVEINLAVQNTGLSPGSFKAIVRGDEFQYIDVSFSAGELITIPVDIRVPDSSQTVVVSWGTDERSATIKKK